MEQAVAEIGDR